MTVIRNSKYEASDVFPGPGSNIRHPLSVFPSLHRVQRDQFPGFNSSMKVLRLPAAHLAALRFLRLAIPRCHSLFSLPSGRVGRQGLELLTRYLRPGCCRGSNRISQVPGEPQSSVCHVPNRRRQDCLHQTIKCNSVALGHRKAKAPTNGLSTRNSMAFELAVYASQRGLPQHHARLTSSCWSGSTGRDSHPQGSDERFQSCRLHLIPPSQALLGAIPSTSR